MEDLPDGPLSAVLNHPRMASIDRASAARACTRFRSLVVLSDVALKFAPPTCVRDRLVAALRDGRAVETLNVVERGDPLLSAILATVAHDHPNLVKHLREVRVWCNYLSERPMSRTTFPALDTVYYQNMVVNPDIDDPRVCLDIAALRRHGAFSGPKLRVARPIRRLEVSVCNETVAVLERAHADGVRALSVRMWEYMPLAPADVERAAEAMAAIATEAIEALYFEYSLAVARRFRPATVRHLALYLVPGVLEALHERIVAPTSLTLTFSPEMLPPSNEWAFFGRLVARGGVAKLLLFNRLPWNSIERMLGILAVPNLTLAATTSTAISLFSRDVESALRDLTLTVAPDDDNVALMGRLGRVLAKRRHLRSVTLERGTVYACDAAYAAFVEGLGQGPDIRVLLPSATGY